MCAALRLPFAKPHSQISQYTWDAEDRLIQVLGPGITESYAYDAEGRRIGKTSNDQTVNDLYDGMDITAEVDNTGKRLVTYTQGPNVDDPLIRVTNNQTLYYHADGQGSIVATSSTGGTVIASQLFDAWGNKTNSSASPIPTYGYTGREPDATGLMYYRARYYDPAIGRFISRDPAGMPDGVNRYSYVRNNPTNLTDPTGLYSKAYNPNTQTSLSNYFNNTNDLGNIFSSGSYSLAEASQSPVEQNPFAGSFAQGTQIASGDPLGSYLPGTKAGASAAQYWADKQVQTGNSLYAVPGVLAALWTPDTAISTAVTLGTAGLAAIHAARPFWQYYPAENAGYSSSWITRGLGWEPPYAPGTQAAEKLSLPPYNPGTAVRPVDVPWSQPVRGPRPVEPQFGKPGGGVEYKKGWTW